MKQYQLVTGGDAKTGGIGIITEPRLKKHRDMLVKNKLIDASKVPFEQTYTLEMVKDAGVMPSIPPETDRDERYPLYTRRCHPGHRGAVGGEIYSNGTRALLPVNLTINQGEFITLLGPSGCGKSTLLKMVAGLVEPSDGKLMLWRRDSREKAQHPLSFVFQEATLMPWSSVRNNVRLPLDLAGVPRAEGNARVSEVLELVGLGKFADVLPRELSGGMQMRVSIARGLLARPKLLLMDEPFGALDEITRNKLDSDLLRLWQEQNLTVVFVTHSIHEAVFLSQRVIVHGGPSRTGSRRYPHPRAVTAQRGVPRQPGLSCMPRQLQDSVLQASQSGMES